MRSCPTRHTMTLLVRRARSLCPPSPLLHAAHSSHTLRGHGHLSAASDLPRGMALAPRSIFPLSVAPAWPHSTRRHRTTAGALLRAGICLAMPRAEARWL